MPQLNQDFVKSGMKAVAQLALDAASVRGVTYADARVVSIRNRSLSTKNGRVGHASESESFGLGVLVTRLWYIHEVDPYEKIVTGITRDGTFLMENGKVQCGLRNFRFNQSLISMLRNVEAMGAPV